MRVLVVDDSEIQRSQVSMWLKEMAHEVQTAIDGTDALNLLKSNKYDVLILDNAMPGLSGFELVKAFYRLTLDDLLQKNRISKTDFANLSDINNYKSKKINDLSKSIMKEHSPSIVILTADPLSIERDLATYLGVNYWVVKPMSQQSFNTLLKSIVGAKR